MSQVQSRDEPFSSRVGLVRWELVPFNSPIEREWQGDDLERPPVALNTRQPGDRRVGFRSKLRSGLRRSQ